MSKREHDLQRQLDAAQRRIAALEHARTISSRHGRAAGRAQFAANTSDWWHGGSTQGARSRHMRVNY